MSQHSVIDTAFVSASEAAAMIRERRISSRELTRLMLDRIERFNPSLNAYITVLAGQAMKQADAADQLLAGGTSLGPLHGVPVAVKDNMATAGIRTTAASRILVDWVPAQDATVVARLKRAGAVVLGKLNMYELAYGGVHEDFGECRNPWDLTRACSASSSGPACVVGAGLAYGSLGSDTGGSVRLPAAACGVVGLKPTYGLVSRAGVVPGSYDLDHVGPLGRTVADVALLLQVVAGHDPADPACVRAAVPDFAAGLDRGLRGLTVGVPKRQASELLDREMGAAYQDALGVLEREGAVLLEVEVPDHIISRTVMWGISAPEIAESNRKTIRNRAQDYSPAVRSLIQHGEFLPATEYIHAQRVRQVIRNAYRRVMDEVDVIAMPVVPFAAYHVGAERIRVGDVEEDLMPALTRYCPPFNITGQPAISVPAGFDAAGLPLAFQIAGRWLEDGTVLRVASAYERAAGWHLRHPELPG